MVLGSFQHWLSQCHPKEQGTVGLDCQCRGGRTERSHPVRLTDVARTGKASGTRKGKAPSDLTSATRPALPVPERCASDSHVGWLGQERNRAPASAADAPERTVPDEGGQRSAPTGSGASGRRRSPLPQPPEPKDDQTARLPQPPKSRTIGRAGRPGPPPAGVASAAAGPSAPCRPSCATGFASAGATSGLFATATKLERRSHWQSQCHPDLQGAVGRHQRHPPSEPIYSPAPKSSTPASTGAGDIEF